jgi:flagellin-like hook-associated protein FlgL
VGLRISTNLLSLSTQRNLATTTRALQRSMQRLSSGNRINTGRDDPAGLAMASGLESQRRGLLQAVRNINDSRGFLETADGAMAEQTNMIQRMRELAVQASNGTLDNSTRRYLDNEFQSLLAEFSRLTTQTQFNGINLLDGSFGTKNIQVGSFKGATIDLQLSSMQPSSVFTFRSTVGAGTYQARTTVATGSSPLGITSGDINADGYPDLVSADNGSGTGSIFLGNGNGTFKTRTTVAAGINPDTSMHADLNGDGKQDIVISDGSSSTLSIFLGNGDGTFKGRSTTAAGAFPFQVLAIDVNGDGRLDLVSDASLDNIVSVSLSNGDGTFKSRTTYSTGSVPKFFSSSDINGDGFLDLMVPDNGGSGVSILLGNGNGTFAARTTIATSANPYTVISVDLSGDGKIDIVSADTGGGVLSFFLGNGNGTFATRSTIAPGGSAPFQVSATDVNNDGIFDLVSSDRGGNNVSIYIGNANGTFRSPATFATGVLDEGLQTLDFNGDGIIDIVTGDASSNTASILLGNATSRISVATVSIVTQSQAQDMLQVCDNALAYINSARASVGALQSRLDFASSVNQNTIENISAARSEIMDVDLAAETAEFSRLQILQKAGVAVLGQANLSTQLSLKLLANL